MSPNKDRSPRRSSGSHSQPALPPAGAHDEVGEQTMESVDAGLLGSSGYVDLRRQGATRRLNGDELPVEAELVQETHVGGEDDTDAGHETINVGAETLTELHREARQLGDFELERKVGQGGMGEVWLARQISLDRPVAVKVLPRQLATQENFIERFQREAKAAASLVHPNVIQIYAYGIDQGTPYFAMEYVEGEDLQERIRRERLLDWGEVVDILMGASNALSVAHEKGIVHRDIKPSNIMIDRNGIVKVMDFGLAKATSGGPEAKNLTNAGLIMGTPNYLSPEQGRGDPLDGRSDLYSLGIVFFELLTGSLPFRADTPAGLIFKHVYEPPPHPRELRPEAPPFLCEIALKLLEKDQDDRYRSAQELLADLAEFYDNYDYYVDEEGERRPESGYLDPTRVDNMTPRINNMSGGVRRGPASTSSRRNAVTEAVTKGVDVDDEEAATIDPRRRTQANEIQTAVAEVKREQREQEERERKPKVPERRPATGRMAREPKKGSRAPLVVLVLLLLVVAGGGYLWVFENKTARQIGVRLKLLDPAAGETPGGQGPGTSGTTPLDSGTTTPRPPAANEVQYSFPLDRWAEGVTIQLARAKHDPYALQRGSRGSYPTGDDYRITFERAGYEPISMEVKLSARKSDPTQGVLRDASGSDLGAVDLTWRAAPALRGAYESGAAALQRNDLAEAEAHLARAKALDPNYRPAGSESGAIAPSVSELLKRLAERRRDLLSARDRQSTAFKQASALADKYRWRAAQEALEPWPAEDRPPAWDQLIKRCEEGILAGSNVVKTFKGAISTGHHDVAQEQLTLLEQKDPDHPKLPLLQKERADAAAARKLALVKLGEADLQKHQIRLDEYISNFGGKDKEAQQRLKEVVDEIRRTRNLAERVADLEDHFRRENYSQVVLLANRILADHRGNQKALDYRDRAVRIQNERTIAKTITELDGALVKGDLSSILALLDPKGPGFATERKSFTDLAEINGRFLESKHRALTFEFADPDVTVQAEWTFRVEVLGQPPRTYTAQHRIQLRAVNRATWRVRELRVEGGIRAQ